jgi:hypothetical protein
VVVLEVVVVDVLVPVDEDVEVDVEEEEEEEEEELLLDAPFSTVKPCEVVRVLLESIISIS